MCARLCARFVQTEEERPDSKETRDWRIKLKIVLHREHSPALFPSLHR